MEPYWSYIIIDIFLRARWTKPNVLKSILLFIVKRDVLHNVVNVYKNWGKQPSDGACVKLTECALDIITVVVLWIKISYIIKTVISKKYIMVHLKCLHMFWWRYFDTNRKLFIQDICWNIQEGEVRRRGGIWISVHTVRYFFK